MERDSLSSTQASELGREKALYNDVAHSPDDTLLEEFTHESEPLEFTVSEVSLDEQRLSGEEAETSYAAVDEGLYMPRVEPTLDPAEGEVSTPSKIEIEIGNQGVVHGGSPALSPNFSGEREPQFSAISAHSIEGEHYGVQMKNDELMGQTPNFSGEPNENEHFSAVDPQNEAELIAAVEPEEFAAEGGEGEEAPPQKGRKGSVLGMGWFQGFSLFILGLIFIGLAILAYFMLGEEPLHEGPPKYVLEEVDGGLMARFNPEIPEEIRESYQYVAPERTEQETEVLKELPKLEESHEGPIELLSLNQEGEVTSEEETLSELASESRGENDEELPALTLFSAADEGEAALEEGVESNESNEALQGLIHQAQAAMQAGRYVGIQQDDAYYLFTEVLKLDPQNEEARAGIYTIANIYYDNAARALGGGHRESAKQFIAIGRAVMPNHDGLRRLEVEANKAPEPTQNLELFEFQ